MATLNCQLPGWILAWFYISAILCTWDATFIMLRPGTFPGGKYFPVWYLYQYYIAVDGRYKDLKDSFVFTQSLLNYFEVVLNIVTIVMHYFKNIHTKRLAFTVTVMTFWKTVLYMLMLSDSQYRQGTLMQEIFIMYIPNSVWVFVPFLVIVNLWNSFSGPISSHNQSIKNGKKE